MTLRMTGGLAASLRPDRHAGPVIWHDHPARQPLIHALYGIMPFQVSSIFATPEYQLPNMALPILSLCPSLSGSGRAEMLCFVPQKPLFWKVPEMH